MFFDNKVLWSEGMFLRVQHFQQFDRYVEKLVRMRAEGVHAHGWGLTQVDVNQELLATGKVVLSSARGVLRDGTPFSLPDDADPPAPLEPSETTRNATVYLALPVRQPGRPDFPGSRADGMVTRFTAAEYPAPDSMAGSATEAAISVGRLGLRLMLEGEDRSGYTCLGVTRIAEIRSDRRILLDDTYIPPCLSCGTASPLNRFIDELHGLLRQRAEALALRASQPGAGTMAQITDLLMLQICNRYQPLLAHYAEGGLLHPETLYGVLLQLAGEITTFTRRERRPPDFGSYRHDDLQASFAPVILELRQALSAVLEQTAIAIPLQERRYGIRVGLVNDRSLIDAAKFILAVRAEMPAEQLRRNFPAQVKIGPVEQIRDLVMSALPGIAAVPVQAVPREIPLTAGNIYFQLDQSGTIWSQLRISGGLAIHLAGEFPQVAMELWAVRSQRQ
jgi:type VI secretion system protein ImpJ